jgi:hypothetical protein
MGQGKEFGPYVTSALNDAGALILLLFLELIYTFKSELELVVIELEHSSSSCLGSNLKINLKIAGDNLETTSSIILGTCKSSDSFPFGPPTL